MSAGREAAAEAHVLRVREEVDDLSSPHLLLAALPELGAQQVGVMAHERLAHLWAAEQEGLELLREHVERADRIPRLARQLGLGIRRRRDVPEPAKTLAIARSRMVSPYSCTTFSTSSGVAESR